MNKFGKLVSNKIVISVFALIMVLTSLHSSLLAQDEEREMAVDLSGKGDGYTEFLYDNTTGLPTSEANAIAETEEGFIWIGSYSGLIRYDGNAFERIDPNTGIANVVSLFVDRDNRLWVGTNDSGIAVIDGGDIRMFNKNDGLKSLSIRSITQDAEGNIYAATTNGIVYVDPGMTLHVIEEPLIEDKYIRGIGIGSDDVIYGVTVEGEVFTIQNKALTGFYTALDLGIRDMHSICPDVDNPGYVYIGTAHSQLWYGRLDNKMKDPKIVNIAPLEYINSVEKGDGVIWVCTDNGIGMIVDGEVVVLQDVPLNSSIERSMRDYQGNLWFVSSKQGVMKIVPNQFCDIFKRYGLDPAVVQATCCYENKIIVGTKNDGIIVLDSYGVVTKIPVKTARTASGVPVSTDDLIDYMAGCKIRSIVKDSSDRLWISTYSGNSLVKFDHGNIVTFTTEDGLPSSRVRTVCERNDGTVMAVCTGGIAIIENDRITKVYDESSGIGNTEILTAVEADNGDMIAGTDGDGMYIINDAGARHLSLDDGLRSEVIMRIKRDLTRNIYWIVTSNSIAYMDDEYNITTINEFPYSNNFDLYENSLGDMWILSSNGIYVCAGDDLIANEGVVPVFYGIANGLPCITTANSYSYLTEEGDLYIAGTTGVAKVNIETPFDNVADLKAAVPYVDADGTRIYPDEEGTFHIPFDTKKITVHSYVFTYSLINPQVTYYLDGFDSEEKTVRRTDLGPIDYTNLHGGVYKFVIKISDAMGRGTNEITVKIVKEKAFYENVWFYLLVLGFIAFILWYVIGEKMKERTEVLEADARKNRILVGQIAEAFAKTIDMKDRYTNGHSKRVAEYTRMLARELGYDDTTVEDYYHVALLHDIGKIGVDSDVLNKNGKLNDSEFAQIKAHAALGYNVLKDIKIMEDIAIGAGQHHERPDGKGYPRGLKGDQISRVAQIIAVADTFDAMYSDRPYRKRMNFDKAVSIIRDVSGTQLTPDVVDAFLRLVEKGKFKDPDDDGGGTTEDIDNIHKRLNKGRRKGGDD